VHERIGPDAERVGREDVFAWDTFRLLAREGVVATAFPRVYGGTEASMLLRVRIIEELASVPAPRRRRSSPAPICRRAPSWPVAAMKSRPMCCPIWPVACASRPLR
jgi:hypothetical protein